MELPRVCSQHASVRRAKNAAEHARLSCERQALWFQKTVFWIVLLVYIFAILGHIPLFKQVEKRRR